MLTLNLLSFTIHALLILSALGVSISSRAEAPPPKGEEDPVEMDLNVGYGDIVKGFFLKKEAVGNTFLFRLKVVPDRVWRVPVLWLTDEQARQFDIDKVLVLRKLARLASSDKPEDKEELRKSLVREQVEPRAVEKK